MSNFQAQLKLPKRTGWSEEAEQKLIAWPGARKRQRGNGQPNLLVLPAPPVAALVPPVAAPPALGCNAEDGGSNKGSKSSNNSSSSNKSSSSDSDKSAADKEEEEKEEDKPEAEAEGTSGAEAEKEPEKEEAEKNSDKDSNDSDDSDHTNKGKPQEVKEDWEHKCRDLWEKFQETEENLGITEAAFIAKRRRRGPSSRRRTKSSRRITKS
jgi:hypothetical protein